MRPSIELRARFARAPFLSGFHAEEFFDGLENGKSFSNSLITDEQERGHVLLLNDSSKESNAFVLMLNVSQHLSLVREAALRGLEEDRPERTGGPLGNAVRSLRRCAGEALSRLVGAAPYTEGKE